VATAFLAWVGYLVLSSRRRRAALEDTPSNLQPYLSDDELENTRVTRVLNAAVIASAVLAIALPIYYLNEGDRQEAAAEARQERDVEEGEHWYENFSCINCHGPDGGGGAAPFVEPRSGLDVAWTAPSINDVFLRYSEDEMRYWINFGRAGTPMPANGLEGGGAMTVQEVDQVVAYQRIVADALARIENGDATVARRLLEEQAVLADTEEAPAQFAVIETFPGDIDFLLAGDGTCTSESAALVGSTCRDPGLDDDRDGLTNVAEERLTEIGSIIDETILVGSVRDQTDDEGAPILDEDGNPMTETVQIQDPSLPELYGLALDPTTAFSSVDIAGEPVADLDRVEIFITELDTAHLTLSVITERQDVFLGNVQSGIDFLEAAAEARAWDVDFDQVAADTGLSREQAERAVGLFNGYCARCHTSGYPAGVAFEQEPGSGAWGPSLLDGRSVVQFPSPEDHVDFVTAGSEANVNYGVNGIGRGWMPGFGQILSLEDIELIVAFERSL
jgi:mono/diheme cytochrome c family protein